jgi:AhpD family alkylhydroperoxidase
MRLEQREKELAAIGASIGANCRPCIEHHLPAGREAGLSETELVDAVAVAQAVRHEAIELLSARVDELLGRARPVPDPGSVADKSRAHELVALGASVGANSHRLLDLHIATALEVEISSAEVEAALKTAEYVQQRAGELTAEKATHVLEERGGASAKTAARNYREPTRQGDPHGTQVD